MRILLSLSVLLACLPSWSQIEPDRVFPRLLTHIPKFEQGFKATLLLKNESKLTKEVTFNCFDEKGDILNLGMPLRFRISEGTTLVLDGEETLPTGTSHVTVLGSSRVKVSVMYGTENDQSGSQALLHETQDAGRKFVIYPTGGNPQEGYWEGLALINLGTPPSEVVFRLKDANGDLIADAIREIDPMAKFTTTLGALFADSFNATGFQIEVESETPISLIMLSGNADHQDFANVFPEALSDLEPLQLTQDLEGLPKTIINFEKIASDEEVLTVTAILPNPCHDLELYWTGAIKESFPPQVDLYVVGRDVSDICFQPLTKKTRAFDLASLSTAFQQSGGTEGDTLIVNVRDEEHRDIIFTYSFVLLQ